MWITILCIDYFVKNIYNQVYVWCCKYAKKNSVKNVPMNNYEILNIQACSFHVLEYALHLVASCKYWVVPLVSTGISCYSQVILLKAISKIWITAINP